MHWYLVHTKPRQEVCALENLQRQGYPCYLPMYHKEKVQQGQVSMSKEPLFPRYLFIRLGQHDTDKSWLPIRSTRGVTHLVRFGHTPAKVDEELINWIKRQEVAMQASPSPLFCPGERVRLTTGAFANIEGVFQKTDGPSRALVLIELLSKSVLAPVATASLRKVG